jgi:hypothetical protein
MSRGGGRATHCCRGIAPRGQPKAHEWCGRGAVADVSGLLEVDGDGAEQPR